MSSLGSDPVDKIHPEPIDHFDRLPDSILVLVFNNIGDVKSLGRCCVVSRRFHSLIPQVENVVVRVDCVISDDNNNNNNNDSSPSSFTSHVKSHAAAAATSGHISNLFRILLGCIVKPLEVLVQFIGPKRSALNETLINPNTNPNLVRSLSVGDGEMEQNGVTHHSPTQVLSNFEEIRFLLIELPTGDSGVEDGVLLKWRADFGSTLENCVILGATSVTDSVSVVGTGVGDDNGSIPESFYTNGGLKLRVVWTIRSLIAASARHYLLQPIIVDHKSLDSLVLTDSDGQGVLCMNRDQLEELRVKPLSVSSASRRTLIPALNMRLWYAPQLELPNGVVLKGATLVAIRPSDQSGSKKEVSDDASWLSNAFEEPYGTAVKMLVKRKTYCLEMNSF